MKPKKNREGKSGAGYDCCQTPPYAVTPILWALHLKGIKTIWECAAGEGAIADELAREGFKVARSDILTGHDFFDYTPNPRLYDAIVTNPPYSIKYKWLARCYEIGKPFALLMPLEVLGAQHAQIYFRNHGVGIILLSRRVNFKMPRKGYGGHGAQFPVAWFTWGLGVTSLYYHDLIIPDEFKNKRSKR